MDDPPPTHCQRQRQHGNVPDAGGLSLHRDEPLLRRERGEGLTQPGAWYLDRNNGNLYYYPIGGKNPGTSEIIAPASGTAPSADTGQILNANGASYVTWQGITFSHADWYLPAVGYAGSQFASNLEGCEGGSGNPAWYGVGPGLAVAGGSNLTLQNCTISHVGGTALTAMTTHLTLANGTITDIGADGLKLGGTGAGDSRASLEGGGHTMTGNTIHDIGVVFPEGTGIFALITGNNTITHNLIYNVPSAGIAVGWDFSGAATACKNNLIAQNEFYQVQQALSDTAAVYLLGSQPGTVVQNNKIHDLPSLVYGSFTGTGGIGMYIDEGGSSITLQNNWVYRVTWAFLLHMCQNNTLQNNVFVDPSSTFFTYNQGSGNRLAHNIVYKTGGVSLFGGASLNIGSSDYNLFYDPTKWSSGSNLTVWKSSTGFEAHSQAANPQFVGYASDNFALSSTSPALSLGFQQINMSGVGPIASTQTIAASTGADGSISANGAATMAKGGSQTLTTTSTTSGSSIAGVAVNGSVTATSSKAGSSAGDMGTLPATPNTGSNLSGRSGDAPGTSQSHHDERQQVGHGELRHGRRYPTAGSDQLPPGAGFHSGSVGHVGDPASHRCRQWRGRDFRSD